MGRGRNRASAVAVGRWFSRNLSGTYAYSKPYDTAVFHASPSLILNSDRLKYRARLYCICSYCYYYYTIRNDNEIHLHCSRPLDLSEVKLLLEARREKVNERKIVEWKGREQYVGGGGRAVASDASSDSKFIRSLHPRTHAHNARTYMYTFIYICIARTLHSSVGVEWTTYITRYYITVYTKTTV